jgi:sugar fermentation stimulation protein A
MRFETPLIRATLLRRYQRFLADVRLDDGTIVTAFCPNTGRMLGYSTPGMTVWLSEHGKPNRRCRYVLELVETPRSLVLAHPARSNRLAIEAIEDGRIPALAGYARIRREVR